MKLEDLTPVERKKKVRELWIMGAVVVCIVILFSVLSSSCNVTRTVTTKAEYYQKGDTTIQIVTKTTESYDGKVDATKLIKY